MQSSNVIGDHMKSIEVSRTNHFTIRFVTALVLATAMVVGSAVPVYCSPLGVLDYSGQASEKRPELLEQKPVQPQPVIKLPPIPPTPGLQGTSLASIFVSKIQVSGSTVFTAD